MVSYFLNLFVTASTIESAYKNRIIKHKTDTISLKLPQLY